MIEVHGIDHVNLSVSDLDRSVDFYARTFGLEVKENARGAARPFVIMGKRDTAYLALHESRQVRQPEHPFLNHWGFVVGNLDPVLEALERSNVKVRFLEEVPRGVFQFAHSRSVYVEDPDGHEIELTETFGGGLG